MHEMSLMRDLLRKIQRVAQEHDAARVVVVGVRIGALAHISADHFREHFEDGVRGSLAEGAQLDVEVSDDTQDPQAQSVVLVRLDVE